MSKRISVFFYRFHRITALKCVKIDNKIDDSSSRGQHTIKQIKVNAARNELI